MISEQDYNLLSESCSGNKRSGYVNTFIPFTRDEVQSFLNDKDEPYDVERFLEEERP